MIRVHPVVSFTLYIIQVPIHLPQSLCESERMYIHDSSN